ncbi:MAG: HAD family hydrolase [Oscillospiraceae bacterium]|nr:HAD family hydrolase [Oscillospiraceae bacterium]
MVKFCIFDLDGTVLDTVHTIAYYGNGALSKHGVEAIPVQEYKYLVGKGAANLVKNMLHFRQCYSDDLFEKVFADYNTAYNADVTYKTTIYDGLLEVLDSLKQQGMTFAIVSNKPDYATQVVINALYGKDYFAYVTGQKPGAALKPDPTVVFEAMAALGAAKEECVYIGDTSTDMKTGKNAGLYTVGVLWGFRGKEELEQTGADAIAETPARLHDIIISRN